MHYYNLFVHFYFIKTVHSYFIILKIEHFSTKKTNTKVFWMVNLGTAILCCIYLLISILNKELLIGVFGETLNKVINSIIIVIILLPYLLERINVIRRYNKIKQRIENK